MNRYFRVNFAKSFRTAFLKINSETLLYIKWRYSNEEKKPQLVILKFPEGNTQQYQNIW